jgi:serine protease Do
VLVAAVRRNKHEPSGHPQAPRAALYICNTGPAYSVATLFVLLSTLLLGARIVHASEEDARNSVIKVVALRAGSVTFGSAVVIAPERVITNCHVVRNSSEIKLISRGRVWYGRVTAHDVGRDLCVVTAPELDIPSARIGSSRALAVGHAVFAAGYPGGEQFTSSAGHVKGLHEAYGSRVIQTSAYFQPGASGGGLFDVDGRLVGILTFKGASGGDFHFVLPVEWVTKLIDEDTPVKSTLLSGRSFWENELREQPFFLQVAALEEKNDWRALLRLAKKSIVKDVERGEPWIAMSKAYTGLGRTQEAESALQRARDMAPARKWLEALAPQGLTR